MAPWVLLSLVVMGLADVCVARKGKYQCHRFCQCQDTTATCTRHGKRLQFIPSLPANITVLIFDRNYLPNVTRATFANISHLNLSKLALTSNHVTQFAEDAFADLRTIKTLDLSGNHVKLWSLRATLSSIQKSSAFQLTLNDMGLSWLYNDTFSGLVGAQVERLSLKRNRIKFFNEHAFQNLTSLHDLILDDNWINKKTSVGIKSLYKLSLKRNQFSPYTPLFCPFNQSEGSSQYPRLTSPDQSGGSSQYPTLTSPDQSEGSSQYQRLISPDQSEGSSQYPSPIFPDQSGGSSQYPRLRSLYLGYNYINVVVRDALSCLTNLTTLGLEGNVISVLRNDTFSPLTNLKVLFLHNMPVVIKVIEPLALRSSSLERLHFAGNNIKFKVHSTLPAKILFQHLPNLRFLDLSKNYLNKLSSGSIVKMFSPLNNLQELILQAVRLHVLPEKIFHAFPNLVKLNLNGNTISTWNVSVFNRFTKLQTLLLQGNVIQVLTEKSFPPNLLRSLRNISLANNPFACTCENMWFRDWIENNVVSGKIDILTYPDRYACHSPTSWKGRSLKDYRPTVESCKDHSLVRNLSIIFGCVLVLVIVSAAMAYRARWYLQYYVVRVRRWWAARTRDQNEALLPVEAFKYDGYVIYSDQDSDFVRRDLRPLVERGGRHSLFIRDRDGEVGVAKVDDMVDNMYDSRRVIAVVSRNFMADQWCQFQLDVAVDRKIELREDYLLLVKLQDIDSGALSKSWCVLLTKTPTAVWSTEELKGRLFAEQIFAILET